MDLLDKHLKKQDAVQAAADLRMRQFVKTQTVAPAGW